MSTSYLLTPDEVDELDGMMLPYGPELISTSIRSQFEMDDIVVGLFRYCKVNN